MDAQKMRLGKDVYLVKTCPEHGDFRALLWRGEPAYAQWENENACTPPLTVLTQKEKGCPHDCGVCPEHQQQACCVLLEITHECNQHCAFCFADAGKKRSEPSFDDVIDWMRYLISISEKRPFNIQLSGGEPTLRDDLPEIIRTGKKLGLPYIQLNTNGLRLAEDAEFVWKLKDAGVSAVFLQFDGTRDDIYECLRGRKLLDSKIKAIENCICYGIGTVLVPTLVPGVNVDNIGEIINFALERLPAIRGVHFQPVSYFGRYPEAPGDKDRITLPEIMQEIETQTNGSIKAGFFSPLQSGSTLCSFKGSFVLMEDGAVRPLSEGGGCACCTQDKSAIQKARDFVLNKWVLKENELSDTLNGARDFEEMDRYIYRLQNYGFSITGMAFQDVWNIDLQRLNKCSIHVFDGKTRRLIPFCAYNLTASDGTALYREQE
jgi:uncharacterized radical SAM superfamily Fe-S cluster-containing enzyme